MNDYELLYYCHQHVDEAWILVFEKYDRYINLCIQNFLDKYHFLNIDCQELMSQSHICLMESIYNYSEEYANTFFTFFGNCLRNKHLNYLRTINLDKHKSLSVAQSLDTQMIDEAPNFKVDYIIDNKPTPHHQVGQNELIFIIKTDLQTILTAQELKILDYWLHGYSYEEIANLANIKVKKVDNQVQKFKKQLKYMATQPKYSQILS